MDEAFERHHLHAALKQVRANQGSPGVDGMSVDELPDFLKAHWPEIKAQLFDGTEQPWSRALPRTPWPSRRAAFG